jgi:protoheme IX farnesyltransferase
MSDQMRDVAAVPAEPEGGQQPSITGPPLAISSVADWIVLLKPRVLTLVVFTGIVGLVVAPGHLHPVQTIAAILCIAGGAGGAGAINMWYDRDIDAIMRRTSRRPDPAGRIAPGHALGFGTTLAVASVLVMGLAVNIATAVALAISIAFYVFVYTIWLKRRTPQNIVVGGAAGAFPPVIGWMAVTGTLDVMPLLMFAIIFFWTPPHFWSLSLWAHADYRRAGVPMLPVVAGAKETRRQVVIYTVLLVALSVLPWALGEAGVAFGLAAAVLGLGFLLSVWRVAHDQQDASGVSLTRDMPARAAFRYSILYLFALFAALAVDGFVC